MNQVKPRPRSIRRYLRFSLRAFLVVVALLGAAFGWLTMRVQIARRERVAIENIGGCQVFYDYQRRGFDCSSEQGIERLNESDTLDRFNFAENYVYNKWAKAPGPAWLRNWLGDDVFANVTYVCVSRLQATADGKFMAQRTANLAPLAELASLEYLDIRGNFDPAGLQALAGLRHLKCVTLGGVRGSAEAHLAGIARFTHLERLAADGPSFTNGAIAHVGKMRELRHLSLPGTLIDDDGMQLLRQLTALETLFLRDTHVGDDGIAACAGMTQLRLLDLTRTSVNQTSFKGLERLSKLKYLNAGQCQLEDFAIEGIGHLTNLVELDLTGARITDAAAGKLASLKKLQKLTLSGTEISDECLPVLAELTELRELDVSGTKLTDEAIVQILKLRQLAHLDLANTLITDRGVAQLRALSTLRILDLAETKVTDAGFSTFARVARALDP